MGNSTSQVVQLRPVSAHLREPNRNRKIQKHFSPENRVLPAPIAGQRLRSTDNGSILQNGGTISGRKLALLHLQRNATCTSESDFTTALKRSQSDESGRGTLYGHRKSHSDPDIVRSMQRNKAHISNHSLGEEECSEMSCEESSSGSVPQLRSIIAESPSKVKIRLRKKGRAPDPPVLSKSLPRDLDQLTVYGNNLVKAKPRSKSPAPLPPVLKAPPPPTDTHSNGYEKNKKWKPQDNSFLSRSELLRRNFGEVEAGNHNRNVTSDIQNKSVILKKDAKPPSKSLNQSFQEEILAAARKKSQNLKLHVLSLPRDDMAISVSPLNKNIPAWNKDVATKDLVGKVYSNEKIPPTSNHHKNNNVERQSERIQSTRYVDISAASQTESHSKLLTNQKSRDGDSGSEIKKYFFSNMDDLEHARKTVPQVEHQNNLNEPQEIKEKVESDHDWHTQQQLSTKVDDFRESFKRELPKGNAKDVITPQTKKVNNEISRDLTRDRSESRNVKDLSRSSRFSSCSSSSSSDKDDSDDNKVIGVKLRPLLPRKAMDLPQFSPTQAWKNITVESPSFYSSDISGSSSSEDTDAVEENPIINVHRPVAPRRSFPERCTDSGISPDAGSPLSEHDVMARRHPGVGRAASPPEDEPHWIPHQDLLEDSDLGSVQDFQGSRWAESPAVSPQTKLTLPSGMFVNKQLDSVLSVTKVEIKNSKIKNRLWKHDHFEEKEQFSSLRSLKNVFRPRHKSIEEAKSGLDSNWSLSRSTPAITAIDFSSHQNLRSFPSESVLNSESEGIRQITGKTKNEYDRILYLSEFQNAPQIENKLVTGLKFTKTNKKVNKFSYQNTLKREAKLKLEEKVSREVAEKEQRREAEIKWMNRVEEEFRKRRDREKINIRYQLKMLSDEETTLDSSGELQNHNSTQEPVSLPFVPSRKTNQILENVTRSYTTSSVSTSSPDLQPNWNNGNKQATGMSKWLKKHSSITQRPAYTRPEPEGGRSSGDEFRPHENINSSSEKFSKPTIILKDDLLFNENREIARNTAYNHKECQTSPESLTGDSDFNTNTRMDSKKEMQSTSYMSPELRDSSTVNTEANVHAKKKINIYKHLSSLAEREELYLTHQEVDSTRDPTNLVPKNMPFSTEDFRTELRSKVPQKSPSLEKSNFQRSQPIRNVSKTSRPLNSSQGNYTISGTQNENARNKDPVIQLSTVIPFNPSKVYKPVPFDFSAAPAKLSSSNSSSLLRPDSHSTGKTVQAR